MSIETVELVELRDIDSLWVACSHCSAEIKVPAPPPPDTPVTLTEAAYDPERGLTGERRCPMCGGTLWRGGDDTAAIRSLLRAIGQPADFKIAVRSRCGQRDKT